MNFSSKLLQNAVDEMSQLPGIGKRTALRLVLFLLNQPNLQTVKLSKSLVDLVEGINLCKNCHNISDLEICEICSNPKRDKSVVCVVEDIRDVMAIESTGQFDGVYHVLGGKISPIEGIGPNQLNINSLLFSINCLLFSQSLHFLCLPFNKNICFSLWIKCSHIFFAKGTAKSSSVTSDLSVLISSRDLARANLYEATFLPNKIIDLQDVSNVGLLSTK